MVWGRQVQRPCGGQVERGPKDGGGGYSQVAGGEGCGLTGGGLGSTVGPQPQVAGVEAIRGARWRGLGSMVAPSWALRGWC